MASFFRRRFGAATVDLIAEPLLGGIHAGDVEQLSMRSVFPRLMQAARAARRHRAESRRRRRASADTACSARCAAAWRSSSPRSSGRCHAAPCARARAATQIERRGSGWTVTAGAGSDRRVGRDPVGARARGGRAAAAARRRRGAAVRRGAVRLDGQRRARLGARRHASAGRQRLRGRAPAQQRSHHGVHVGVVEVGRTAPRRITCCCAPLSAAPTIPARSISTTRRWSTSRSATSRRCSASPRRRCWRASTAAGTPARSTSSATSRASRRWLERHRHPAGPVRGRQRLRVDRHPGLRGRRPAHRRQPPPITLGWDRDLREAPVVLDRDHAGSAARSCSFRPEPSARRASPPRRQPTRT